jgi:hypothetical protein
MAVVVIVVVVMVVDGIARRGLWHRLCGHERERARSGPKCACVTHCCQEKFPFLLFVCNFFSSPLSELVFSAFFVPFLSYFPFLKRMLGDAGLWCVRVGVSQSTLGELCIRFGRLSLSQRKRQTKKNE